MSVKSIPATMVASIVVAVLAALAGGVSAGGRASSGSAQMDITELTIEDLMNATVQSASKFDQKMSEAPSSVSIVTADEIKKYGYRTLGEILRSTRGIYVTSDRNYQYVGVRGFNRPGDYNTRVLLLTDGHRINDNIYEQAIPGTEFPLDVDLIDRVEIIRGPGSSLYGSNAFFAVVNVITKDGRTFGGTELSGEGGSFESYKGRVSYGNTFANGADVLLSASLYDSAGQDRLYYPEFDTPDQNNGIAENGDDDGFQKFFAKASLKDVTLTGLFSSREKGIPTAPWETVFNDRRNRSVDDHGYLDLRYEHSFSSRTSIAARLFYDYYSYYGRYVYPPPDVIYDAAKGTWWGAETQVVKSVGERQKWIVGMELRDNIRQSQLGYYEDPYASVQDLVKRSLVWALYAQDEIRFTEKLLVNIGVRYDYYDTFGGSINPRLAIVYQPWRDSAVKLLYGTAFRTPNMYELDYQDNGVSQKANPDLIPETITTYEVIYEQFFGGHYRASLSGYHYLIEELISLQPDPTDFLNQFRNADKVTANGVEMELEGQWERGIKARLSYAYQRAEYEGGKLLENSPRHMAKANVSFPLFAGKLFGGVEVQYMGRRNTVLSDVTGNHAGAFTLVNLTVLSQKIAPGLEVSASIYNLFDKGYGDPGAGMPTHLQDVIEQDGRTFRAKLTYSF